MATGPPLGMAAGFAVLGGSTVTNTGATQIGGSVGVSPGASITGFPPGVISGGAIHAGDALATQAEADLATAYDDLAAEPVNTILSGQNLGGLTLTPGVYQFASAALLDATPLTFDAQGNSKAVFVIQVGTTLTTAANSSVDLINSAHANNIYWQLGSSATLGTNTTLKGNILALTNITLSTGAGISPGRAMAINGAVTMDTNTISNNFSSQLTINANNLTSVYGAALPKLTVSYTGFINGDIPFNLTTPPNLSTSATASSPVGTYSITASGAVDPDYTISYGVGTLTITRAPLVIAANPQLSIVGSALPQLSASYTGLVNGDTVANLTALPTLTTLATSSSPVGGYTINASGAIDPNYVITYAPSILTITPLAISGKVYLDLNASGTLDPGEPGLPGRVVFLDLNHTGVVGLGDPTAATDPSGNFSLINNTAGTGPVLYTLAQDAYDRYVVDQTVTNANGTVNIGAVPISPIAPVSVIPDPFSTSPSSDANTAYIASLYRAVLGRVGGTGEVHSWVGLMNSGMTDREVAGYFNNSLEHRQDQVHAYYEEFLHRAPDATSVFWVNSLMAGVSEESIVESILNSPEYQAAHQNSTTFITDLYFDVLGRQGDSLEIASWQGVLSSGVSRQAIAADFVMSTEAADQIVESNYTAFLHRQRESGTSDGWVNMLVTPNGSATEVAVGILSSAEFELDAVTAKS